MKKYHRVIITGDHGTSRLAARFFHIKDGMTAPPDTAVCSHGRYCKSTSSNIIAIPNTKLVKHSDGSQYLLYTTYDHFKKSGFAAGADDDNAIYGEVHGGATPEEALVPIIVIDSNYEAPLTGEWDSDTVKISMKKAKLTLSFSKPVHNLQVKVANIDGEVSSMSDGTKWSVVLPGIKPDTYSAHVYADNTIVEVSDITVLPALSGGMGDLI